MSATIRGVAHQSPNLVGPEDMSHDEGIDQALGDLLGNFHHLVGPEAFELALDRGRGYYADELLDEADGQD